MNRDIDTLLKQMTLEEKAGLCSGDDNWHLKAVERLGIPRVMVSDGPHGLRKQPEQGDHLGIHDSMEAVCFPAACATAASFDEGLMEEIGDALGEECQAEDISILLGPAINIKRSPLCGRNFEYFSEDPYLTGKLAAAEIRGIQRWDVGVSVKHFAANNQEYRRMTASSQVGERTLREIYLSAFEMVVKEARPWTLMCSYNRINGEFASENRKLLTDILRTEWGFDGYVMSDWGAVNDRVKGLEAGLELEMPASGGIGDKKIVEAVKSGELDEAVVDQAVRRILEKSFRYLDNRHPEAVFDREAHHKLAVKAETECAVLLKNNGILPLSREASVAYIGGFAETPRYQGGGSSHVHPHKVTGALDDAGKKVAYAEGFSVKDDSVDEKKYEEAVKAAASAEIAVIFAGLPDRYESEGYDRQHMRLPECQNELISRIAKVQENVVVVLHNGSPVELPWEESVGAILELYLGGEGVGEAADALLYGDANPCGRLPETFPFRLEDNPSYLNFPGDGHLVDYAEGIYVGYRYYDSKKMKVRYPFGHGLSYTEYEYHNCRLDKNEMTEGESLTLSLDVTNVGKYAGKEVVQVYVSDRTGTVDRPSKELKGFAKVALEPGETKRVSIAIDTRGFQWYHEALGDWYASSGQYAILVCRSAEEVAAELTVEYHAVTKPPFRVDRNTTIEEILKDARTAPAMIEFVQRAEAKFAGGDSDSSEIIRQMLANVPLRGIQNFTHMSDEALEGMIGSLNSFLKEERL